LEQSPRDGKVYIPLIFFTFLEEGWASPKSGRGEAGVMAIYEIRDPVYGFIQLNEWEKQIIDQPAFQRLRRIRQLGLADMVYPSAIHSRFEHSLGVMHLATLMYDALQEKEINITLLKEELSYENDGIKRDRQLIRIAALLHDVGHTALSHAGEECMPSTSSGKKYRHEDYTAAIVREKLKDTIEKHQYNKANYHITAEEVAYLIEGNEIELGKKIFWKALISSQLDADRGDYLLRDSIHTGVKYGLFDYNRLINTISLGIEPEENQLVLAVDEGGLHVAEALILARYSMFTQVYFHKTGRAYNCHLNQALRSFLPNGTFPPPNKLDDFLDWDDWKIFQLIKQNAGTNCDCDAILQRKHIRRVYETLEQKNEKDLEKLERAKDVLGPLLAHEDKASNVWYNMSEDEGNKEIFIIYRDKVRPLSLLSKIAKNIGSIDQIRLYTLPEDRERAEALLKVEGLI